MTRATTAPATPPSVGDDIAAPAAKAASGAIHATATAAHAIRIGAQRPSIRDNGGMPAVSQALVEFANTVRSRPAPGIEVTATPRYHLTLQPDFPAPGPNGVAFIRCRPEEADDVIDEVRAHVAPRHLPLMWILDPGTEPADFGDRLAARGVHPDRHGAEVGVMVLAVADAPAVPQVDGLVVVDALSSEQAFRDADAVAREAFGSDADPDAPGFYESLERRRLNQLAGGYRHVLMAVVDGEPAGTGGMTIHAPDGAIINGGAVLPRFRGRGVYRALVAARLDLARSAGVPGVCVWGGAMSRPILERLGFTTVGWRRFYLDTTTA